MLAKNYLSGFCNSLSVRKHNLRLNNSNCRIQAKTKNLTKCNKNRNGSHLLHHILTGTFQLISLCQKTTSVHAKLWKYFESFEKKSLKMRFSNLPLHFPLISTSVAVLKYSKQFLKLNRTYYKTA